MKQQTKEIIKTAAVVVVIALLVFFYWIYPLNRAKAFWGRADLSNYRADSVLARPNDPGGFATEGAVVDTFRVEADGNTTLAGLILRRPDRPAALGTVILLHAEREDRTSLIPVAKQLTDSGFLVVVYDQRASGLSTGTYHSDGRMEASDLETVVAHLGIHNKLTSPVVVVGWKNGGDAALFAQLDEKRIAAVLAIEPYLTSTRFIDAYSAEFSPYRFPFFRTLMWFWLNARSSYGLAYNDGASLTTVGGKATLMVPDDARQNPSIAALVSSASGKLDLRSLETDRNKLVGIIVSLATAQPANQ